MAAAVRAPIKTQARTTSASKSSPAGRNSRWTGTSQEPLGNAAGLVSSGQREGGSLTESTTPSAEQQDPTRGSSERSGGGTTAGFVPLVTRYNTVLTLAAASVAPILYLIFIDRYATNSFFGDDWSVAPTVRSALSDHLSLSQLWANATVHLFVKNTIDVLFGFLDRFDLRSVMFLALCCSLRRTVLLALFRRYLGTRLTPIPVLVVGVTWFSLADVENSLWAFQVSWYLTLFFFVLMLFALEVPASRRTLWFVVAVIAALAASLSTVQGFLCWPLGAVSIVWSQPWKRRAFRRQLCGSAP